LWLSLPAARAVVKPDMLPSAIENIQAQYDIGELRFIKVHSQNLALHKAYLADRRYAWHDQKGQLIQQWQGNERWEDWLLDLHHRFLLGNTIGLNMAGFAGLLLLPLIFIGLRIWWPRRRFWVLGFRVKRAQRGEFIRAHSNLGASISPPVILLAITGVILVYPSESRWLLQNGFSSTSPPPVVYSQQVVAASWVEQIAFSHKQFPGSQIRWVQPELEPNAERVIGLVQAGAWDNSGKTSLRFSTDYVDNAVQVKDARQQSLKVRGLDLSYVIHTGDLGFAYRFMLIVIGFGITWLCLLGLRSYWRSRV